MTTIKIPKQLRARVTRSAAEQGLTAAGLIDALLDEHERHRRFEAVRAAYAVDDPTYTQEVEAWDGLAGDGLES